MLEELKEVKHFKEIKKFKKESYNVKYFLKKSV